MDPTRRHLITAGASALATPWALAQPTEPEPLVLANAVYPPLVNPPGDPRGEGVDIDVAREALRRGGAPWPVTVQWVPWKRVLFMLERGLADLTTTVNHSPERERFLRFSDGYRNGTRYFFFSRKGLNLKLRKLDDLRGHRLALAEGFFYPEPVLAAVGRAVEYGKDVATAVRLVEAGRADVVIVSHLAGLWAVRQQRLEAVLERQPLEFMKPSPVYMAFSRERPRSVVALAAMNAGLASMRADGSIARIEAQYMR